MNRSGEPADLPRHLAFDEFRVDTAEERLTRRGEPVPITPKIFALLTAFLERPGELLTRAELYSRMWPDKIVEDANLTQSVFVLRKLLGDRGPEHRFIVTEPGEGYRFIGEVAAADGPAGRRRWWWAAAAVAAVLAVTVVLLYPRGRTSPTAGGSVAGTSEQIDSAAVRSGAPGLDRYATSFPAYAAALEGRYHLASRAPERFLKARSAFRRALEIDPEYAPAWSGLSTVDAVTGFYRLGEEEPLELYRRAAEAARRAVELDPALPTPHAVLGLLALVRSHDPAKAEHHLLRAIAADPQAALPHHWYAWVHLTAGRIDEAEHEAETAYRNDPLSLIVRTARSMLAYYSGDPEAALRGLDEVISINDRFGRAHLDRGLALEQLDRLDEAEAALDRAAAILGWTNEIRAALAHLQGVAGRERRWRELTDELEQDGASPALLAFAYAGGGDHGRALALLERAIDRREVWVWDVLYDPRLAPLRHERGYERLRERLLGAGGTRRAAAE